MFGKAQVFKPALAMGFATLLVASQSPHDDPGIGVLCLGTMVYFIDKTGQQCRAGEDPEFQARISAYVERFDDYIIRNIEGGQVTLERFKDDQNLNLTDPEYICEGDVADLYDHFKALNAEELDIAVEAAIAIDGPPRWGDCI